MCQWVVKRGFERPERRQVQKVSSLLARPLNREAACLANIRARHMLATDEGVEKGPDNDERIPT